MRRATLVLATSVAFLVSGTAFAVTGSRTSTISSAADLVVKGTLSDANGNLRVQSPAVSGVYIPAGASASTEVAVATRTAGTVAKAAVANAVKAAARVNGAVFAAQGAIAAATAAVDWLQKDGTYVKKIPSTGTATGDPSTDTFYWTYNGSVPRGSVLSQRFSSLGDACKAGVWEEYPKVIDQYYYDSSGNPTTVAATSGACVMEHAGYSSPSTFGVQRMGSKCPEGSTDSNGTCLSTGSSTRPLTEQDYNDLGDWVQQQDGTFVRQAAIEGCYLSVNPESCFQSVVPDRALTGPATITGTPSTTSKTITTTSPDGTTTTGTATTTTTPAANITYNNNTTNNITYNTYDKTVTKNPDGSTTETTSDEGPPNVPDLTDKPFEPIGGLPADIAATGATGASLPFLAWFSMGGQCREHTFMLPVLGALTTNYCPIHEAYVRPFLYFIFSVWTFMYCFQIWRESTVRVRIM